MARLKLKGQNQEIEISNERAKRIKALWMDDNIFNNQKIDLDFLAIEKGRISSITLDEELPKGNFEERIQVWNKEWREMVERSAKAKAQNSIIKYEIGYFAVTGNRPSEKEKEIAETEMEKWFEENPYRTFPDMRIFWTVKDAIPEISNKNKTETMKSILRRNSFMLIENCTAADIQQSNYYYPKKADAVVYPNDEIDPEEMPF